MDIKPFVQRVFKAYQKGTKQPAFFVPSVMIQDKVYKVFGFEVLRSDMSESFWDEMAPAYEGTLSEGRTVRVEKDTENDNRVLIGVYVPSKDEPQEPGPEIQEDTDILS